MWGHFWIGAADCYGGEIEREEKMTATSLYETDFYGWTQQQAQRIRAGATHLLDFDNILEEIEAMGRSDKRSLRSRLTILLMHLIKWQYQPEYRSRSWRLTIIHQRQEIDILLLDSPSLKSLLDTTMVIAWQNALKDAEAETGIDKSCFPQECPWAFEILIAEDFWPDMPEDDEK